MQGFIKKLQSVAKEFAKHVRGLLFLPHPACISLKISETAIAQTLNTVCTCTSADKTSAGCQLFHDRLKYVTICA